MKKKIEDCDTEINMLKEQKDRLKVLNDQIVCSNCANGLENSSKTIDQIGPRQHQRKVKELKTKAERALWFLESYGVHLKTLSVEDSSGQELELSKERPHGSKYEALSDEEKTKIKEVLHVLDKFCVGDAAYHVLSVLESGLPRSYMVKQCRGDINGSFIIKRTPGDLVGAQMSFIDELRRKIKEKVGVFNNNCLTSPFLFQPQCNSALVQKASIGYLTISMPMTSFIILLWLTPEYFTLANARLFYLSMWASW